MPVILGGDHTIAWPDVTGVARHVGWGRVSVIHFDAHADTGDTQFGSLIGHGTPMRRLIESGAARGDRFLQIGLRGYWPEPATLAWMAEQGMRSFEMTEVVARGLDACLTEAMEIAMDDCDGVFLSVDVDVVDPGAAPGTGTPEPGGLSARQLLDAVRRIAMEVPLAGMDVVEVSPPYDNAEVTAYLGNRVVLEALSGVAWRRRGVGGCQPARRLGGELALGRAGEGGRGGRPTAGGRPAASGRPAAGADRGRPADEPVGTHRRRTGPPWRAHGAARLDRPAPAPSGAPNQSGRSSTPGDAGVRRAIARPQRRHRPTTRIGPRLAAGRRVAVHVPPELGRLHVHS